MILVLERGPLIEALFKLILVISLEVLANPESENIPRNVTTVAPLCNNRHLKG